MASLIFLPFFQHLPVQIGLGKDPIVDLAILDFPSFQRVELGDVLGVSGSLATKAETSTPISQGSHRSSIEGRVRQMHLP